MPRHSWQGESPLHWQPLPLQVGKGSGIRRRSKLGLMMTNCHEIADKENKQQSDVSENSWFHKLAKVCVSHNSPRSLLRRLGHHLLQHGVGFHDPFFLHRRVPQQLANLGFIQPVSG